MAPSTNRNRLIGSVAATLRLLEVLAEAGGAHPLATIAQKTGQPKSSVHRMLASLVHMGYVEQEESSRYRLTFKLLRLGMDTLSAVDVVKVSKPHLDTLMRATNESAYLSVLDASGQSVYLAKVEAMRPVRVKADLGALNPAWCSTTGWAMLAYRPDIRDKVLAGRLVPKVPTAIADPRRLRIELERVAATGCAITRAQGNEDTGGIAAPIRSFSGSVVAACGIGMPLFRMDAATVRKFMPLVVQAATAISAGLGFFEPLRRPSRKAPAGGRRKAPRSR